MNTIHLVGIANKNDFNINSDVGKQVHIQIKAIEPIDSSTPEDEMYPVLIGFISHRTANTLYELHEESPTIIFNSSRTQYTFRYVNSGVIINLGNLKESPKGVIKVTVGDRVVHFDIVPELLSAFIKMFI